VRKSSNDAISANDARAVYEMGSLFGTLVTPVIQATQDFGKAFWHPLLDDFFVHQA
jgi:hypothetical protein